MPKNFSSSYRTPITSMSAVRGIWWRATVTITFPLPFYPSSDACQPRSDSGLRGRSQKRVRGVALQLRFLRSSESIGLHDSEIVDDGYFDRDDAGALGVIAAGCQSADGAIVYPGAGGGFCGLVPGRTTRRRAAQDRLDAGGSGGRSRSLAPAGHSGSRMVGR